MKFPCHNSAIDAPAVAYGNKRILQEGSGVGSSHSGSRIYIESDGNNELGRRVEMIVNEEVEGQNTQAFSNDYEKALPEYYRLIRVVGRGGMAEVFLAEDKRLGRNVAIKFLNSEFRREPERMRRFTQEARAASALNHPNILTIHDIGENEGVQYIVSEFVEGETISSRILRGKLPVLESVEVAIQIASALAASHRAGIVHRDLKPDNVMVRDDGSVKVLDFGLAKETRNDLSNSVEFDAKTLDRVSTSPGLILGTPQYMSPEQARGYQLDARSDIFSLGIIIFEMVTGRPPFRGNSMADTIAAILTKEPKMLEEYLDDPPLTLIRIVQKTLRKDKNERYGTMDHLLSDLKDLKRELLAESFGGRVTGGTEVRATVHQTTATPTTERLVSWNRAFILLAVLGLGLTVWWLSGALRPNEPHGSMRSVPITSWSSGSGELIAAASFSPDAKMVAFAATKSGSTEIWVKPSAGGDEIQVTKNEFYNQYPVWSPNGQEIAFFSSRGDNRGIWRASFTGGAQVQMAGGVGPTTRPVYWSKGKIYFQESVELFTVDETSGEQRKITDFGSSGLKPRVIEISADESRIAYSIKDNDVWRLMVKRLDAETSEEIAASKFQFDHFAWHPDGERVIFSNSIEGSYQVFEAAVGRADPVQISNGNLDFFVQDVSSDGSKILYGSASETSDLWMIDQQDSKESVIANDVAAEFWADVSPDRTSVVFQSVKHVDRPFGGSVIVKPQIGAPITVSAAGFSPVWSPDSKWIAYFKRTDEGMDIWRVRPTGDDAAKLADGAVNVPGYMVTPYLKIGTNHLSWSPDGASLAYSLRNDGISNIWVASSVDGSGKRQLSLNSKATETYCCPIWTRDGKAVLFTSEYSTDGPPRQTTYRIWLYTVDNSEQRLIFESKERFRFLGLSDTGTDAVISMKADPADLTAAPESTYVYVLSIKAGARSRVNTLVNAYSHNIHLSRDGKSIAFVSRGDNMTALWTVPVKGGTPKRLLIEKDPKVLISTLAWSPDGNSIVFGRQTRTNMLSMLAK